MTTTKKVPVSACRFDIGEFQMGDNGDNAKSAPVKMIARTGDPINHWYWGKIIHDLDGMQLHKNRIAIDYCHSSFDTIGYLNKFDIESGDLIVSGAITPMPDDYPQRDFGREVIFKSKSGVPYEASIDFSGPVSIEEIGEGHTVEVNGREFAGPGVVVRKWNLRSVAVCPYGADMNTETEFAEKGKTIEATVITCNEKGETEMSNKPVETEAKAEVVETEKELAAETSSEVVEAEATEANAEQVEQTGVEAEAEQVAPEAELAESETELPGQKFMDAFGEVDGAVYFARGMSFEDAMAAHLEKQTNRIAELEERLAQSAERGAGEPVQFRATDDAENSRKKFSDLVQVRGKKNN